MRKISVIVIAVIGVACLTLIWPCLLDIVVPLNESRPLHFILGIVHSTDQDEHIFLIFGHALTVYIIGFAIVIAVDSLFSLITHHHCAIFRIIRYFEKRMTIEPPVSKPPLLYQNDSQ